MGYRAGLQGTGWGGQVGALTKGPQAVVTGIHTHLQHAHQSEVIYLGQGLLQEPWVVSPGLGSGHSLPVTPFLWLGTGAGGRHLPWMALAGGV